VDIVRSEAEIGIAELLDRVERGEEITVTRDGRPVARIMPVPRQVTLAAADPDEERRARMDEAIRKIKAAREGLTPGGLSIREMIDEGRR
jgi:prevent-host-death family protein